MSDDFDLDKLSTIAEEQYEYINARRLELVRIKLADSGRLTDDEAVEFDKACKLCDEYIAHIMPLNTERVIRCTLAALLSQALRGNCGYLGSDWCEQVKRAIEANDQLEARE